MISLTLLKRNLKSCLMPFFIIFAFLCLYTTVIIYMYNPELSSMLSNYQKALPEMMNAVGMSGIATNLLQWIQIYLYGFIMLLFPLIFVIILVNKLLMSYIDNGSMASLLATPNSRGKVIRTQLLSMFIWLTILMVAVSILGIAYSQMEFPGQLDVSKYIVLNICTLFLWFAVGSISFCTACFVSESKYYYLIGAGLPIAFFMFQMLGNMGDKLKGFKYVSLYSLLPTDKIVSDANDFWLPVIALLGIAIVLSIIGCYYFKKRDLFV